MAIHQITAKQSRQARSLLKWNIHDVLNKCEIRQQRLDQFERGTLRISRPENDALVKVYLDHGIIFTSDHDVKLGRVESAKQRSRAGDQQDRVEDLDELRQLEVDLRQKESGKVDLAEETAKDFQNRVQKLVNLKDEEDKKTN